MKRFETKATAAPVKSFAVPGQKPKVAPPAHAEIEDAHDALDDIETVLSQVDDAAHAATKDFYKGYEKRIADTLDTEFYIVPTMPISADGEIVEIALHPAIVFQSRARKEEFLAQMSERFPGEILGDKYISGELLARALGFTVSAPTVPLKKAFKPNQRAAKLVR